MHNNKNLKIWIWKSDSANEATKSFLDPWCTFFASFVSSPFCKFRPRTTYLGVNLRPLSCLFLIVCWRDRRYPVATHFDLVEDVLVSSGLARIGVDMGKGLVGSGTELTGVVGSNRGIGGGLRRELTGVAGSNRGAGGGCAESAEMC